jgi:hypothetical protein
MENAGINMFAINQRMMMETGLQREQWRYFNRYVLTPNLNTINIERIQKDQIPVKRRRKI